MSEQDILNEFNNIHLKQFIQARINIAIFEKRNPEEIVGTVTGPDMGGGTRGVVSVKARDFLAQEQKKLNEQLLVLEGIKEVEVALGLRPKAKK